MAVRPQGWFCRLSIGAALLLVLQVRPAKGGDSTEELRALIEQQGRQIQELQRQLNTVQKQTSAGVVPAAEKSAPKIDEQAPSSADSGKSSDAPAAQLDDAAVKKIVTDYLKDNPGAGMPPSVQTGYQWGQGFVIKSAPNPKYIQWDDDCRVPFEIRFRGRIQLDYYRYKVTDEVNHITNKPAVQNANSSRQADFSQLEVKRLRLIWEGCAFDPDLRFNFTLDTSTRGVAAFQNNRVVENGGTFDPNTNSASPIGGGVTVDHGVRFFEGWVAYDFHGCAAEKGCGLDCPDAMFKYSPTYTVIAGKLKPFFCIEEVLGSANEQLVEFSMADWFFDAEDDNLMVGAGTRIKAFGDRFYL